MGRNRGSGPNPLAASRHCVRSEAAESLRPGSGRLPSVIGFWLAVPAIPGADEVTSTSPSLDIHVEPFSP